MLVHDRRSVIPRRRAPARPSCYRRRVARGMKPGMQRDLLVAFWLLFDEFEIGDDDPPAATAEPNRATPMATTKEPEKPKRNGNSKNRRRP